MRPIYWKLFVVKIWEVRCQIKQYFYRSIINAKKLQRLNQYLQPNFTQRVFAEI